MATRLDPCREVPQDVERLLSFAYPLVQVPGYVALYTLVRRQGSVRLEWDGIARVNRVPPRYGLF